MLAKSTSNEPVKLFLKSWRAMSLELWDRLLGKGPDRLLFESKRCVRLVRLPTESSRVPMKLLLARQRLDNVVMPYRSCGMEPSMRFNPRESCCKCIHDPNPWPRTPPNLLTDKSRALSMDACWQTSVLIRPERSLWLARSSSRLVKFSKLGRFPVKKLLEMLMDFKEGMLDKEEMEPKRLLKLRSRVCRREREDNCAGRCPWKRL